MKQASEYDYLFNHYKMSSEEELKKITVSNGYTELAEKVAIDILNSDRAEYNKYLTNIQEQENMNQLLIEKRKNNPLYEDVHQIATNIQSIKNILLFFVILTILGLLFGFYTVFVTIPKLF